MQRKLGQPAVPMSQKMGETDTGHTCQCCYHAAEAAFDMIGELLLCQQCQLQAA